MLNRKIAPTLQEIKNYQLPLANIYTLDNDIKVYEVNAGDEEIIKLEIIFHAGRWHEDKKLVSRATTSLLREGSKQRNGAVVAEHIDFYGGSIRFPSNLDTSYIQVYCMTKYLENILPVISEILENPLLPEKEFRQYIERSEQRLKVDLEKNDTVAYRQVTEMIYGKEHPYGYNSSAELLQNLERADLVKHYEKNYVSDNCLILVSGRTQKNTISLLNKYLGSSIRKGSSTKKDFIINPAKDFKWSMQQKEDSIQSAIRLGKRLFERHDPDYFKFFFLNTVLGGYFGSRLMQNLREDKGYTYNIYSTVDAMMLDGYFMIGTEVHSEKREVALKEIYSEFKRLREEKIGAEELEMVRNYLLGTLLTAVDGAFNIADVTKTIILNQLPQTYYQDLIQTIKTVTADDLQRLAQNHLQEESFYEVIVE